LENGYEKDIKLAGQTDLTMTLNVGRYGMSRAEISQTGAVRRSSIMGFTLKLKARSFGENSYTLKYEPKEIIIKRNMIIYNRLFIRP